MNERSGYSPFPIINLALDHARLLIGLPLAAAVAAVLFAFVTAGRYTAESTFKPQVEQAEMGRFSGLAAQFGIDLMGGARGESMDFYARLARSRALLEQVATRQYPMPDGASATLVELYGYPEGPDQLRRTVEKLARNVGVEADLNSGVVTIRTRERGRALAEQMNRAILDEVNRFNLERRQSQASAERTFVEAQVVRARQDLETAEQAQSAFMQTNRRYEEWPQLRVEAARLQRQVDLQQQVFTTLTQALERARLDEVRNTPVITIIDQPEGSAQRQRRLIQKAVLGAILGLAGVLSFLFAVEYARRLRQQYPDEFDRVRRRRPWIAAALLLTAAGCEGSTLEPVAAPLPVVALSSGGDHTCALTVQGIAACWGSGTAGQLGNRRLTGSHTPEFVDSGVAFRSIGAGQSHTCALAADGAAWCWGWNPYFQRGNSSDTATARPVAVSGGHRFETLSAGSNHTCALKADGSAWCWGYNRYGQLGDGTTTTPGEPVAVLTGVRFSQISAGGHHSCALSMEPGANVYCWGLNAVGQVGAGGDAVMVTSPVPAAGAVHLATVSAGFDHSCGLSADGILYCWGGNAHGQLANGGTFPAGLPGATAPVASPTEAWLTSVSAGMYSTCGIDRDGTGYCWGRGADGQLGTGTTRDHYFPQPVLLQLVHGGQSDLLRFTTVSLGRSHTCGSTTEGAVYCWGNGSQGQLGRTQSPSSTLPLRVALSRQP
jgi:alpha-tubulin suppressor-like RCC1 family protein